MKSLHIVFAAFVLLAYTEAANADVTQCIDADGLILFSDTPCPTNANVLRAPDPTESELAPAGTSDRAAGLEFRRAEQVRSAVWTKRGATHQRSTADASTVQAARTLLTSMDVASALVRQQALLARQNMHAKNGWAFWRS